MHNCINNTGGNLSHLEQMVNNFLPYSKQQLGFDQPVKIVFQSDPSNADVLLGKTAHYNPEQYEVYLYTDKRHPKDIMRSLSHELVHHAQNCRGDFGSSDDTSPGYAQRDPHLRKMEREAYTKGNLIFRDFEDLIKRGKITIDINFKDSGEPQMSLKEWKDNELNTLLMKKWGLLKEGKGHEGSCEEAHPDKDHDEYMAGLKGQGGGKGDEHYQFGKKEREAELEEDQAADAAEEREDGAAALMALGGAGQAAKRQEDMSYRHDEEGDDPALAQAYGAGPEDPDDPEAWRQGHRVEIPAWKGGEPGPSTNVAGTKWQKAKTHKRLDPVSERNQRISVREAKEITRRIIERIKKEGR
jgi:hypothetical protein